MQEYQARSIPPLFPPLTAALATSLLFLACRTDKPEVAPTHDSLPRPAGRAIPGDSSPTATTASVDSSRATTGPPSTTIDPWLRNKLVADAGDFIAAIDSGNQDRFWGMLSARSLRQIERGELGPRDTIWSAARQTLGDIRNRHITVIGGSHDSVALQIDGLRLIDSQRVSDPIIVGILRENGDWKIIYPGFLYPNHDMRR